jgi:hypothetical protein
MPAISSCPTSGLIPTISWCSSELMNASACPMVGSRMSHHLRQGEPPHLALVRGERAVLEHRMAEQVRGRRGDHQAGLLQRLAERGNPLLPLGRRGIEVEHVVVVEVHAVRAQLRELADRPVSRHRRAHRPAEHVYALPPHRPYPERKVVFPRRHVGIRCHR